MEQTVSDAIFANMHGLQRYAFSKTKNMMDSEDIVQECIKRAVMYLSSGRHINNMRAYLYTILNNVYLDEMARRRRTGVTVEIDEVDDDAVSRPPEQMSRLACRDLQKALDALPEGQRRVLIMIGVDGMSYQSAASQLDIPIGTVMSRLSRGRAALRRALGDWEPAVA